MSQSELDCDRALELLQDYLKREADPAVAPLMEQHLARCADCLGHARFERNFLLLLQARAAGIRCPDALRARIAEALARAE